jgi:acetyl-CoA C-acetyltransferase
VESFAGIAEVETFTVVFAPDGTPAHGAVVLRLPGGARSLARVTADDTGTLSILMDQATSPIGRSGRVTAGVDGLLHWAA